MASLRKLPEIVHCNLEFEGVLSSALRPKLVHDTIAYLCFQRQQIPMAYNCIKADVDVIKKRSSAPNNVKERKAEKEKIDFVQNMEDLKKVLEDAFALFHPIREILILLGATVVSPKEVYHLRLPTDVIDGRILTQNQCQSVLFRSLVGEDILQGTKDMATLNKWTVLLEAPRLDKVNANVMPRLNFKPPVMGQHFMLNFMCHGEVINPDVSRTETEFEISGIEPLNETCMTLDESNMELDNEVIFNDKICGVSTCNYNCDDDFIWYEVKPSFKGFKV